MIFNDTSSQDILLYSQDKCKYRCKESCKWAWVLSLFSLYDIASVKSTCEKFSTEIEKCVRLEKKLDWINAISDRHHELS